MSTPPQHEEVQVIFQIEGMSCGGCAFRVQTTILEATFVRAATVDFPTKTATVTTTSDTEPSKIFDIVRQLGYTVIPVEGDAADTTTRGVQIAFLVDGMSCGGCAKHIGDKLSATAGIAAASVDFPTRTAKVTTAATTKLSPAAVVKIVKDLGYKVPPFPSSSSSTINGGQVQGGKTDATTNGSSTQQSDDINKQNGAAADTAVKILATTVDFTVDGMTCASCAGRIESQLKSTAGVTSVNVNFATVTATVSYDPDVLDSDKVAAVISGLGYTATLQDDAGGAEEMKASLERTQEINEHRRSFIIAAAFAVPLFVFTMTAMYNKNAKKDVNSVTIVNKWTLKLLVEFLLATPVVCWVGRGFYIRAFQALRHGGFTMDTLVSIGVGGSYLFSVVAMIMEAADSDSLTAYFETAATLLAFMLLGKFLEANAKRQTSSAIVKLMDLAPPTAVLVRPDGSNETVPCSSVKRGDTVLVMAGERMPVDGTVVSGRGAVDESMVTGESVPQEKEQDSKVIGGTLNLMNDLIIRADRVGSETMLSQILRIVKEAQSSKPAIQRVADAVAGIFVPIVIIWSIVVLIVWLTLGFTNSYPKSWRGDQSEVSFAFSFFISTIVVACPCALGLATPTAVMVGTGVGAKHGVLIKGGPTLEAARKVTCCLFDKTGTLTTGKLRVTDHRVVNEDTTYTADAIMKIIGHVEGRSTHPIAKAVTDMFGKFTDENDLSTTVLQGSGIAGDLSMLSCHCGPQCQCVYKQKNIDVLIGSPSLMEREKIPTPQEIEDFLATAHDNGQTVIIMAVNGKVRIAVALSDEPKDESKALVAELHRRNMRVVMVTGDNKYAAHRVASLIGLGPKDVYAQQLPSQKADVVGKLQEEGLNVAFVGDGVNDSPALARADVGIAMGAGTEVAIESADAVLVRNSLADILTFFDLSATTVRRIQLNFVWAFGYNLTMLPIASGVFFAAWQYQLPPVIAGIAMVTSSLTVLASSLALKLFKPTRLEGVEEGKKEEGEGAAVEEGGEASKEAVPNKTAPY